MNITTQSPKISVIIPFFQKKKGILEKAVLSVLHQKGSYNYEIIVVDDGSPVPAREELTGLMKDYKSFIRIVEQGNAGPAAARNKGLDSISADTKYVAFIDSDDKWVNNHLDNAIFALEKGYDCYFADSKERGGSELTRFQAYHLIPSEHRVIDISRNLYEFSADFCTGILKQGLVATSLFVYRYSKYPHLRFNEAFFVAEDMLFFIEISKLTERVVFSSSVECIRGKGINISDGREWESRELVRFCV